MKIRDHTDHRGNCGCPGGTYREKVEYLTRQGRHKEAGWLNRWMKRAIYLAHFTDVSYQHQDLPWWIIRKKRDG